MLATDTSPHRRRLDRLRPTAYRPGEDATGGWVPTRALPRTILLVSATLLAAVFFGRIDLVVIIAPIALGAALGLWWRPRSEPILTLGLDTPVVGETGAFTAAIDVTNPDRLRYDLVVARMSGDPWLRTGEMNRPYAAAIGPGGNVGIDVTGTALRWGRHRLGPVDAHAVAAGGLLISTRVTAPAVGVRVYPTVAAFQADDAMPRASGVVGLHRSRRPGEGGELSGVRVFSPGDRLRRIDWRVSLRTRELHVVSTLSERDAEIVILIDVLHDAGVPGAAGSAATVLDTAVRAAAGIAEHYLHRGDRVSLIEYGWQGRRLRPSSGHRHYLTALEWLLDVHAARDGDEPAPYFANAQQISPNALVLVLTPLIDPRSAAMLARMARSGRFVVAVDTLPPYLLAALDRVPPPGRGRRATDGAGPAWLRDGQYTSVAARLWRLDRRNTIGQLREHGVPVVTWHGAGSLDQVLHQVARMAVSPRIGG